MDDDKEVEQILNEAEVVQESVPQRREIETGIPSVFSKEWNDYVLSQFYENELEGGKPTCDGLRRVTEMLVGPIVERRVNIIQAPVSPNGIATVSVEIGVLVTNSNHPAYVTTSHEYFSKIIEESVADCGQYNTEVPYCAHQSATAETRAEGRALRKILRLRRILTAEESGKVDPEFITKWGPSQPISDDQIEVIDRIAMRANVSVNDFINSGENKYKSIRDVPSTTAATMIQFLNSVAQGTVQLPTPLPKYQQNWRS
jgi:hypothetical protein